MSENKKVFITPKGRKYHLYTSCNYIKGRQFQKISFSQAKKLTKGPCSSCQHLLEKNGDKFDDESVEKEEEKEKEENNKINININKEINNKNKNSMKLNNRKKEEFKENNITSNSSSSNSNFFEVEKEEIPKDNILNFFNSNSDDISGIKQNTHFNDNSKADIDILKDKIDINNKNKFDIINNNNDKNEEEEEDEEDEKTENVNVINLKNINDNKEEYFNNNEKKNSIENMNKLKYNLDPNLPKRDLNWKGKDFILLDETNKSSQLLFLQGIEPIPSPHDKKRLILIEKNDKSKESSISKGNFKFRFEITPYKELKEQLKISVGFEIDYLEEENISKKENMKMNLSYETLILIKHFLINKKTNKIHVMINISSGKFFVIGNDELEKRSQNIFLNSQNSEILFLKNFRGINLEYIKDVRPVFEYDINYLKLVNIDVGRNILNEYSKFGKNK